ncbi:MAG: IucA/IucC family siderophore biosynthesis protein [Pseudonocardiaceae bacterium]|nr:IucA/IucC family siderophore biosynthesis protein [Pseudonocardiaceae bacterium]
MQTSESLPVPAGLTAPAWTLAGRQLLEKALAELSYEQLLAPVATGDGGYRVDVGEGVAYTFRARRGAFGCWRIEPGSVRRTGAASELSGSELSGSELSGSEREAADPLRFLLDSQHALGLSGATAGHLARELTATLAADTRLLRGDAPTAAELADLGYAELEGHQTGHPWLIPSKGRIGFSATDAGRYTPEARRPLQLPWMAVHRSLAAYRGVEGLDAATLLDGELDGDTRARFTEALADRGVQPSEYHWLPVHPWQWDETVVPVFAAEVAAGLIVPLGDGPDRYLAQQSIRTFSNLDSPARRHVKLPLSILNTLVWRGLPTDKTVAAPAVTAWVLGLVERDEFLREQARPVLLGEVASVTINHPVLEALPGAPYQYRELLGAIWREPITAKLDPGERARTLAALLHVDREGRPFVAELVERSGLAPREWLHRLFAALLPPLLHFLYRYGVVFSPHGENTILVSDTGEVPARLGVKDFVDDVNVSEQPLPELADMPADVSAALLTEPPEMLCQFIQSGLFVGHFRYLAGLVESHLGVAEDEFWAMVRDEVIGYQKRFPELADRFQLFDLLAPDLARLCLNRNRLLLDGYADRPERPHAAVHGRVPNPLALRAP